MKDRESRWISGIPLLCLKKGQSRNEVKVRDDEIGTIVLTICYGFYRRIVLIPSKGG